MHKHDVHHIPFSQYLDKMMGSFENKDSVSLLDIELFLADRGGAALLLILNLPFITPIPLPGVSVVFGIAFVGLAFEIVRHQPAKLPKGLAKRRIDLKTLKKIVKASRSALIRLEKLLKPRLAFFCTGTMRWVAGISLSSASIAMALPLPPVVPFTNAIPAFAIVFFALGFLEDDGLFILLGHLVGIFAWVYIIVWWEVLMAGLRLVFEKLF